MRIKNAFKLLFANINVLYKSILCRTVIIAVVALIAYFGIKPGLEPIISSAQTARLLEVVRKLFSDLLAGKGAGNAPSELPQAFSAFTAMLSGNETGVKWTVIGAAVVWYILNFLLCSCDYVFGKLFDDHMSSYSHFGVVFAFCNCAGKAFAYGALISLVNVFSDAIILTVGALIAVYLMPIISVLSVLLGIFAVVFGFSLRMTLLTSVMPAMVENSSGIKRAFSEKLPAKKRFGELLGNYAFLIMLWFYVNVSMAVFTLLSGLLVTLPLTSLGFTAFAFVDYYCGKGKKFYVDFDNVVTPDKDGKDAQYLKYM